MCVFLLFSQLRLSIVSVVFDFNDSLNDVAPVSPMLFPVDAKIKGKEWFVDGCHLCVFFLLFSQHRLSFMSVVFDFSDSHNNVAPVSPMLFAVDVKRNKKSELLMNVIFVSFFRLYSSD